MDLLKRVKKNKIHKPKGNLKKQKKNQHNVTIFKGEPSVERKRERALTTCIRNFKHKNKFNKKKKNPKKKRRKESKYLF